MEGWFRFFSLSLASFFSVSPRSVVLMLYPCHYPSSISPGFILSQFSYLYSLDVILRPFFCDPEYPVISFSLSIHPAHFNSWGYTGILIRDHFHIFIDSTRSNDSLSVIVLIATCINILSSLSVGLYKMVAPLPPRISFSFSLAILFLLHKMYIYINL